MAATFPDIPMDTGTTVTEDSGTEIDMTDDGAMAARQLYAHPYYIISARWSALEAADRITLTDFLTTNRNNELLVTVDGVEYIARQTKPRRVDYSHGNRIARVTVELRGRVNE